MTDHDGKRLFLGLRVSVATANGLAQCAEQLARRARDANLEVKWVAPANYHVTLKFLGWTRADLLEALDDRIAAAVAAAPAIGPFKFKTAKLGAFPSLDKSTVVWAGVEDPGAIAELAKRIEAAAVDLGFPAEPRPFHPHVTLGRVRETRLLREVVLPMSEQMFSASNADHVILFESETKSSGSVYKEISKIALKTAREAPLDIEKRQTGALELGDETDDGWPRDRASK
ncbi:MAG: RNA 2',3'-cyclic phosphodiesterase [Kofleriaceae bacterium]